MNSNQEEVYRQALTQTITNLTNSRPFMIELRRLLIMEGNETGFEKHCRAYVERLLAYQDSRLKEYLCHDIPILLKRELLPEKINSGE